jgi:hypothetical protein
MELPRWYSILLGGGCLGLICVAVANVAAKLKRPSYFKYTMDEFFGIVWRWKWSEADSLPTAFAPFCKTCDRRLKKFPDGDGTAFRCHGCQTHQSLPYGPKNLEFALVTEIEYKVRYHAWPQSNAQQPECVAQ